MTPLTHSPRHDPLAVRIAEAAEQLGTNPLVDWATRLVDGRSQPGDEGDPDIALLGGMEAVEDFMARVWGAQALKYVWHHTAEASIKIGLADQAWQVRLMCCEVVRTQQLTGLTADVVALVSDAHPQVRSTAASALGDLAGPEDEAALESLNAVIMDPDSVLAGQAENALNSIAERFNRPDLRPSPEY